MSSCFSERHSRSMNRLSIQRPRPSIEMRTPAAASVSVKAAAVNWQPWSVLKMAGLPKRQRLLQRRDTEPAVQGVGQPLGEHGSAGPIHDRYEVKEAAADWDVGDVGAPDLVRPFDSKPAQEIRVYLVPGRRLRRPRLRAECGNAHLAHQPANACD